MSVVSQLGHPARIVALDDDADFLDAAYGALHASPDLKLVGHTADPRELELLLRELAPDVALVDHSLPRESGVAVAERTAKAFPGVWVFLLTDAPSRELWNECMARGIRQVVRKPAGRGRAELAEWAERELLAAVREVLEEERRRLARLDGAPERPDGAGPVLRVAAAPRLVAVWSPKGGVGKTTVAVNLALWAQANPVQRVQTALVDLEEGAGTTHVLLGMPAAPTVADWADQVGPGEGDDDELDAAAVEKRVAAHRSGLRCVFQPDSLAQSLRVSARLTRVVLRSLRAASGLVVADCSPTITDAVGTALEMASVILLVLEPTLPALYKARQALEDLAGAGDVDPAKLRLVVNRVPPRPIVTEAEITAALGLMSLGSIPEDPAAARAATKGTPLATHAPNGPFMAGLRRVAAKVVPGLEAAGIGARAGRRPLLPWLARR